jgi:hypothetical protein
MTFGQYGKPKQCQNNCGQEIAWDKQASYFINTSNSQRHDCPKWEKKSSFTPNASSGGSQQSVTVDLGTQEQLADIQKRLAALEQQGSMMQWMIEGLRKQAGIDEAIENDTNK